MIVLAVEIVVEMQLQARTPLLLLRIGYSSLQKKTSSYYIECFQSDRHLTAADNVLHLHQQIDVFARHSLLVDPLLHDLWTENSAQSAALSISHLLPHNSSSWTQVLDHQFAQALDGVRTAASSAGNSKLALRAKLMGESCRDPQFKDVPLHELTVLAAALTVADVDTETLASRRAPRRTSLLSSSGSANDYVHTEVQALVNVARGRLPRGCPVNHANLSVQTHYAVHVRNSSSSEQLASCEASPVLEWLREFCKFSSLSILALFVLEVLIKIWCHGLCEFVHQKFEV